MKASRLTPRKLKQQGERVIGDPAALTRQAQERIALAHRFPNGSSPPRRIEFHGFP